MSYYFHKELNPKLWKNDKLIPEVRQRVVDISEEFKKQSDLSFDIVDIYIVGSNASFNYTEYSDLDMHLIVNFDLISCSKEIVQAYFNALKTQFNKKYDITIKGISVEVYVEDIQVGVVSNGIYSVYTDSWIRFPVKQQVVEPPVITDTVNRWKKYIDSSIDNWNREDVVQAINTLYMIRKNSIAVDGEYGAGNYLFKELRNAGYLDKLKAALDNRIETELSLESLSEGLITEDKRTQLVTQGKQGQDYKTLSLGKNRYTRRNKSRVANTVKEYNSLDMNKLFKEDILTIDIKVIGETDTYLVRISFGGFLELLQQEVERNNGVLNLRSVIRALITGFNRDDVYIHCDCPDFYYRFAYYATRNQINSGDPELRPSDITNPDDNKPE